MGTDVYITDVPISEALDPQYREFVLNLPGLANEDLCIRHRGSGNRAYILIHGIGMSAKYYLPLANILAEDAQVFLVELPGFSRNDKPSRPLSMAEFADSVWEGMVAMWAQRYPEPENVVVVGHSMGTQVAVEMAVDTPVEPEAVVLMAPTVNDQESTRWQQAMRILQDSYRESPKLGPLVVLSYLRCGMPWFFKTLTEMLEHQMRERLAKVNYPVLLIGGDADPVCPPSWLDRVRDAQANVDDAFVKGAAHAMHFSDAQQTSELIRAGLPSRSAT